MTASHNIEKLKSFKELKRGWLGKDSDPIPTKYIDIALENIEKFLVQPNVDCFDSGISFTFVLPNNSLMEINISDQIEFVTWVDDNLGADQIIESKFISPYANRVLKQQPRNA